jgi:serine/threonine-protein kinase
MSPEQVRGIRVDKRADIWAFGVVLYEMVTGKRAFHGETTSDILAVVLKEEPDWSRAPAKVEPLLRRCLAKDPKYRLRDIGDAMPLLDAVPKPAPVWRPCSGSVRYCRCVGLVARYSPCSAASTSEDQ